MLPAWQVTDAGDLSLAISHFQNPLPQRDFIQLVAGDRCFLKKLRTNLLILIFST